MKLKEILGYLLDPKHPMRMLEEREKEVIIEVRSSTGTRTVRVDDIRQEANRIVLYAR